MRADKDKRVSYAKADGFNMTNSTVKIMLSEGATMPNEYKYIYFSFSSNF